jgi:hypothetical protein
MINRPPVQHLAEGENTMNQNADLFWEENMGFNFSPTSGERL